MRLYTICVDALPVLVMSTNVDEGAADLDEVDRIEEQRVIGEALETWLGKDLSVLQYNGRPIWDGDHKRLTIRDASGGETSRWRQAREAAASDGDRDPASEDFLTFLVPVSDSSAT